MSAGKKNCLMTKGGLNVKFKEARVREQRRGSRALQQGLDHPGTELINSMSRLATECELPPNKRSTLLDSAKALVVAGLTYAGSKRPAFDTTSCPAKGCEAACVYPRLHDPVIYNAVPCSKC